MFSVHIKNIKIRISNKRDKSRYIIIKIERNIILFTQCTVVGSSMWDLRSKDSIVTFCSGTEHLKLVYVVSRTIRLTQIWVMLLRKICYSHRWSKKHGTISRIVFKKDDFFFCSQGLVSEFCHLVRKKDKLRILLYPFQCEKLKETILHPNKQLQFTAKWWTQVSSVLTNERIITIRFHSQSSQDGRDKNKKLFLYKNFGMVKKLLLHHL